jgi:hypothetical protein
VGAIHPAGAFHDRRGQHAWFAEQFERNARAHNIHDGIHRADLVKMNFPRRPAMDFPLGFRDALKHGDGFFLPPRRQCAVPDEFFDFLKCPALLVMMFLGVFVAVVSMMMFVGVGQMNLNFHAGDAGFLLARDVQMIAAELQLLQLALQPVRIRAEVNQRADEHVAADAAENVEVKGFHFLWPRLVSARLT